MRERKRSQWSMPLASFLTDRPERRAPSGLREKCPSAALLGIVGPATTFVARRASVHFSYQTQSPSEFFNSLLDDKHQVFGKRIAGHGLAGISPLVADDARLAEVKIDVVMGVAMDPGVDLMVLDDMIEIADEG